MQEIAKDEQEGMRWEDRTHETEDNFLAFRYCRRWQRKNRREGGGKTELMKQDNFLAFRYCSRWQRKNRREGGGKKTELMKQDNFLAFRYCRRWRRKNRRE